MYRSEMRVAPQKKCSDPGGGASGSGQSGLLSLSPAAAGHSVVERREGDDVRDPFVHIGELNGKSVICSMTVEFTESQLLKTMCYFILSRLRLMVSVRHDQITGETGFDFATRAPSFGIVRNLCLF